MRWWFRPRALIVVLLLAMPMLAQAHQIRPGLLQMHETAPDRFEVLWRVPVLRGRVPAMTPRFPAQCAETGTRTVDRDSVRAETRLSLACDGGLNGEPITIEGLQRLRTDVLVRLDYLNGGSETHRATPKERVVTITGPRGLGEVAVAYLMLGIEHILQGIDHLLFVTALLLLVDGWRRLLATITAFTIAHTITLAGATLGLVSAPPALIEALITLSIVFVAGEVVHKFQGKPTMASRRPWLVAMAFGLLHGFGFAGALREIGLPPEAIPTALLFFNVGVEIGQLLFVSTLVLLAKGVALLVRRMPAIWRPAVAYWIGIVAAFWTVERVAAIWLPV